MRVFTGVDEFAAAAGQELGSSDWLRMAINYGLNKGRFTPATTIEIAGSDEPACAAETIGRYFA